MSYSTNEPRRPGRGPEQISFDILSHFHYGPRDLANFHYDPRDGQRITGPKSADSIGPGRAPKVLMRSGPADAIGPGWAPKMLMRMGPAALQKC